MSDIAPGQYTYRYPHPAVAVDLAIFTVLDEQLRLLLVQRGVAPHQGSWALPGGFVRIDEDLHQAAARELQEETGIEHAFVEQLGAFGRPDRDPRERVISIAYFAIIPTDAVTLRAGSDATQARWHACDALPPLAFDHGAMVEFARHRLRDKTRRTTVALQFLPGEFTLSELQRIHELILGEALDKRNFRKWVTALGYLQPTGRARRGGQHRPAALYRGTADVIVDVPDDPGIALASASVSARTASAVDAAYARGFREGARTLADAVVSATRTALKNVR